MLFKVMKKVTLPICFLTVLASCSLNKSSNDIAQNIVENSARTVCAMRGSHERVNIAGLFNSARGVVISPSSVRGAYLVGFDNSSAALVTKSGNSWSYPSFYSVNNLSFGFQAGLENTETILFLMNDKAVRSVVNDQFKFAADAGLSFAIWGAGAEGGTTTNMSADVVVLSRTKLGLYGGVSVKSGGLVRREGLNKSYYNDQSATPTTINIQHNNVNDNAQTLRNALSGNCM